MIDFIKSYKFRRWLYGVTTAVLVFLGGQGIITDVQLQDLTGIVDSLLMIALGGVTGLATKKADPASDAPSVGSFDAIPAVQVDPSELPRESAPRHAA